MPIYPIRLEGRYCLVLRMRQGVATSFESAPSPVLVVLDSALYWHLHSVFDLLRLITTSVYDLIYVYESMNDT